MINLEKYEYHVVSDEVYNQATEDSEWLLNSVSRSANKLVSTLNFHDIIHYFKNYYNVKFCFFDSNTSADDFDAAANAIKLKIKMGKLVSVDPIFSKTVCGFTIADSKNPIVFLNGELFFPRLVFTTMHELSHIFKFKIDPNYMAAFAKLNASDPSSVYPSEILPFENKANVMASNLMLNSTALYRDVMAGFTFDQLLRKYSFSNSALHNRLNDYLIHSLHLNDRFALSALITYRYSGTQGAEKFRATLNRVQENIEQYVRPTTEDGKINQKGSNNNGQ